MGDLKNQSLRPAAVTFAVALLSVSTAIGIVKVAASAHLDNPLTYIVLAGLLAVSALMIWLIFSGKNWGRWTFIVLFGVGLLLSPRSLHRLRSHSNFDVLFYLVQLVLQLAAAIALCLPPVTRWFQRSINKA